MSKFTSSHDESSVPASGVTISSESSSSFKSVPETKSEIEHRLKYRWAMYMHKKTRIDDYKKNTRKLFEFSTVEDFWRKWQNVPKPR